MFERLHPAWVAFGTSVLLLGGSIALLRWDPFAADEPSGEEPLVIWCAEALRVPMEATARAYEGAAAQKVFLHFGSSQAILTQLSVGKQGDLFLPADDSFIDMARKKELLAEVRPLARMTAVAILSPSYSGTIETWSDFVAAG